MNVGKRKMKITNQVIQAERSIIVRNQWKYKLNYNIDIKNCGAFTRVYACMRGRVRARVCVFILCNKFWNIRANALKYKVNWKVFECPLRKDKFLLSNLKYYSSSNQSFTFRLCNDITPFNLSLRNASWWRNFQQITRFQK